MLEMYNMGYDVVTGYRKSSNINTNVITSSSALTFSLINDLLNENKVARNRSITISGTGYFISSDILDKFKRFPFHLMTEDYELSMYLAMNNYNTFYNKEAIFYDEQPTKMSVSIKQRIRWCYGYLLVRFKYRKELKKHLSSKTAFGEYIGIKPYVMLILGAFVFYVRLITGLFYDFDKYIKIIIFTSLLIYTLLVIFTYVLLLIDKNLGINRKLKVKTLLFNPIYLFSFLYCMVRAMFGNVSWEKIEHTGNKIKNMLF
jgi:cellulose synthase/poly-beta-1,6-N-acetylglucosamine synthase-like glycosyltransferase